jgi:hypothetical protein
MSGAMHNDAQWLARVKELEEKIAIVEQKSEVVNTEIVTKIIVKTQYIKQKGEDIIKYVDKEIIKYDNSCVIPKEFVDTINKAAEK